MAKHVEGETSSSWWFHAFLWFSTLYQDGMLIPIGPMCSYLLGRAIKYGKHGLKSILAWTYPHWNFHYSIGGDSLVKHLADEWPCNFKQAVPGFVWNSLIWNRCPMMSFTPVGWLKMMGNTQFGRTNRTFFWATYLPHTSSMPLRWLCGYFKRSR